MKLDPKPDNPCFGCGGANARGMKLAFEQDDDRQRIVGRFRLGEEYQGGSGYLHGGIIALLLDEAMGKAARFHSEHAVTAELRVEYKRPIPTDSEIIVEGFVTRREGRQLYHEGEIRDVDGKLLARGEGRFVIIDREKYRTRRLAGRE
ncbi:MAG TPA: PaaI family thioesterase [Candidatus Saccharimonadales bacterium]|nr:PaaI family thioesterase [Candidatus Saccharimonadales bacterium]